MARTAQQQNLIDVTRGWAGHFAGQALRLQAWAKELVALEHVGKGAQLLEEAHQSREGMKQLSDIARILEEEFPLS